MAQVTLHRITIGGMPACLGGFALSTPTRRDAIEARNRIMCRRLREGTCSHAEVAAEFGITRAAISVYARAWGIPMRKPQNGSLIRKPLYDRETRRCRISANPPPSREG